MTFNTLYSDLACPFCNEKVSSGVGFKVGALEKARYKIGDSLKWDGKVCRPSLRPANGNIQTVGYFNCDNVKCSSWQDCFPTVQQALITVTHDVISGVTVLHEQMEGENFDIIEPKDLS